MKLKSLTASILFLSLLAPLGYGVENVSFDKPVATAQSPVVKDFYAVVTGNDQLVLKPGPVFTEGGHYEGMQLPYLLSTPKAIQYPRWALRQGWEGELSIAVEILKDGSVGRTKVMKSTGHKMLDEAAVKAVHSWKFHAAVKDGQIVLTCIQIPVRFQINDKA
jgi:TonB family protein